MRARVAAATLRIVVVAAVVAAGLTVSPPAASASDANYDCHFDAVSDPSTPGGPFQGFAYGYVTSLIGETVSINCVISVNSTDVAATGTRTGNPAAVTASDVSFRASPGDDVDICADVTQHGHTWRHCFQAMRDTVPPPVVYGTVDGALAQLWPVIDPTLCDLLKWMQGYHGPVIINSQGDVYIDGEPYWDCPPYDVEWPSDRRSPEVERVHTRGWS